MNLNRTMFWYHADEDVRFEFFGGYVIDFPDGVDGLQVTISSTRTVDGIGSDIISTQIPERPITLNGYIVTFPSAEEVRRMQRVFAPLRPGRLYAQAENGDILWLDCVSAAQPTIQGKRRFPRFQVSLLASYPYWQRDLLSTARAQLTGLTQETAVVCVQRDQHRDRFSP